MKTVRNLFIAFLVFSCAVMQAQTQKGSVLIGGSAGFSFTKYNNVKATNVNLSPSALFFVIDQLAVGGSLNIGSYHVASDIDTYTNTNFGIGPAVRYYFVGTGNFRPYGAAGFSLNSQKSNSQDQATTNTSFSLGIGGDYFINDHVAIETGLNYTSQHQKNSSPNYNIISLSIGVAAFIGG